eukprot:5534211-Pyramimonas_sp.AAC.1
MNPRTPFPTKLLALSSEPGTLPIIVHENYLDIKRMTPSRICEVADRMSLADVYHRSSFANNDNDGVSGGVYGSLAACVPGLPDADKQGPSFDNPRFGSMWTRMSAMFQKRKYWNRFERHHRCVWLSQRTDHMAGMNDVFRHLIEKKNEAETEETDKRRRLREFVCFYGLEPQGDPQGAGAESAFSLYN